MTTFYVFLGVDIRSCLCWVGTLFLVSVVYSGSSVSVVATGLLVENAPRSRGQWVSQRDGWLEAKAERAAGKT